MNRTEWRYFLGAALLHLLVAAWLLHSNAGAGAALGTLALPDGDTFSYLDPVEHLLRTGVYAQNPARLATYAGRMPGYGVVYGALRLLLPPGAAANALLALQLLLSLGAMYCLARLAQRLTRQPAAFPLTLLLYGLNTFVTVYDIRLLTESLATSALVIGLFELAGRPGPASAGRGLRAGAWLGWAVFLRPVLAPLLPLLAALTWFAPRPAGAGWRWLPGWPTRRAALLLLLPFALADAAWLARNWRWYGRPVPLQSNAWAGYRTAPALPALARFVGTLGEEPTWWEPASDIAWFYRPGPAEPSPLNHPRKLAPPAYTFDSLRWVRQQVLLARNAAAPPPARRQAAARASRALYRFGRAYRRLRPWQARVLNPLRLAYRLTLAHPADNLYRQPFASLSRAQQALKVAAYLAYLLVVGLGLLGTCCLGWRQPGALALKLPPLYLLVLLCGVLHQVEFRYFVPAYPFVLVGAVQVLLHLRARLGCPPAPAAE